MRKLLSVADIRSISNISNWEEESKVNHLMKISVIKMYIFFISKIAILVCSPAAQVSITIAKLTTILNMSLSFHLFRQCFDLRSQRWSSVERGFANLAISFILSQDNVCLKRRPGELMARIAFGNAENVWYTNVRK